MDVTGEIKYSGRIKTSTTVSDPERLAANSAWLEAAENEIRQVAQPAWPLKVKYLPKLHEHMSNFRNKVPQMGGAQRFKFHTDLSVRLVDSE